MHRLFCQRLGLGKTLFPNVGSYESAGRLLPFGGRIISTNVGGDRPRKEQKPRDVEACRAYLVNSCGLSATIAENASRLRRPFDPKRAAAVFKILRDHGFDDTQVSKLVRKVPQVIFISAEKIVLPKLQFFSSMGIAREDLARIVTSTPSLLLMSLEKSLVPKLEFLKTLLVDNDSVITAMKSNCWIFLVHGDRNLAPNISALREAGVPQRLVQRMMKRCASVVIQSPEKFGKCLDEVTKMGFHPKEYSFITAMHVFSSVCEASRDCKIDILRGCGMSESEIQSTFKKCPVFMILSAKKLMSKIEFLLKDMHWSASDIARFPSVFEYSLESRLMPRCSVIRLLQSEGLVDKDLGLSTFLRPTDKAFYDKFVAGYLGKNPQLLDVYREKMSVLPCMKQLGC